MFSCDEESSCEHSYASIFMDKYSLLLDIYSRNRITGYRIGVCLFYEKLLNHFTKRLWHLHTPTRKSEGSTPQQHLILSVSLILAILLSVQL